jgi:hypothetical protein
MCGKPEEEKLNQLAQTGGKGMGPLHAALVPPFWTQLQEPGGSIIVN